MSLSRTVSEMRFQSKIAKFCHPCILRPRWRDFPWNWVPVLGIKKLKWWRYRVDKEIWRYLQPCGYNAPTWQTDRRTDGQTDTGRQ